MYTHPKSNKYGDTCKVCVRPIIPKVKAQRGGEKQDDSSNPKSSYFSSSDYPVYFYNKEKGRQGHATGFYLRDTLVLDTLTWLRNKELKEENDSITADKSNSP